jgi:hypothetical protein
MVKAVHLIRFSNRWLPISGSYHKVFGQCQLYGHKFHDYRSHGDIDFDNALGLSLVRRDILTLTQGSAAKTMQGFK